MGQEGFAGKSTPQLQKHIRQVAKDSSLIFLTAHARKQMRRRKVLHGEVIETLRRGLIHLRPEPNLAKGSLEVRMEHYISGRTCKVVVALVDEDPNLIVVTVIV